MGASAQVLTKAPTLKTVVEPTFPADAGIGGTVELELELSADGHVTNAIVIQGVDPAIDEAALTAARQLTFTPAELDGRPAPVRLRFTSLVMPTREPDAGPPPPPPAAIRGVLLLAGRREPIGGALVRINGREVISNDRGEFELTDLEPGNTTVQVTSGAHERFEVIEHLVAGERTQVTYVLRASGGGYETVVRDVRNRREVTQVRLTKNELRSVAGTNNDAFRVVQNLPGVARSPFGGSALVVRGSKSWDSRIYVDEIQIPQLFHFAGLTATFNSATVDSIGFHPGNFSADFGRSIGGLVQAEVRSPSTTGMHGHADVNLFDVGALIEAPIAGGWSASASARFSLTQWTIPLGLRAISAGVANQLGFTLAPSYWDYQLRAERKLSRGRIFISLFGSGDQWALANPNPFIDQDFEGNQSAAGTSQRYHRLVVGFDHRFSERVRLTSRNAVGFDVNEQSGSVEEIFFRTTQIPIQLRERLGIEVPEARLNLGFGFDGLLTVVAFDAQRPPVFRPNQLPEPFVTRRLLAQTERSLYVEPGLSADATWAPTAWLQVRGGLRADGELGVMRRLWLNPRLGVRVMPASWLTLKAGAGLYQQPPDWRSGQLSPTFGNPGLAPEGAWHFMTGLEARAFGVLELDVQGYYKALFSQARLSLASGLGSDLSIPGASSRYTSEGYGRAYGMEALLRLRPTKHLTGWVAYTLSRFERDSYGVPYAPGPLDQPHNLIIVASATLPWGLTASGRFRFASGPLITPIVSSLFDVNANQYVPLPGLPWSQRLPDFTQLDLRVDKRFTFDAWSLVVYVDVQNVTNARNPEALFYNFNYTRSAFVTGIPILPTAGVRGEW